MRSLVEAITAAFLFTAIFPMPGGASVRVDEEELVFRLELPGADNVFLVGDFNGWNPTIDRMVQMDGGQEIRLFLLPGRYRYLFIVDGVSMPDPDNPYRDEDGNSYFIYREVPGGYEVVFRDGIRAQVPAGYAEAVYSCETFAVTGGDGGSLFLLGNLQGAADERAGADLGVGFEYEVLDGDAGKGRSYFVGGSVSYKMDRGVVGAFNRSDVLAMGDPLAIFGTVSPFAYPLGIFCRGVTYEGGIGQRFDGRIFYASRIEGFRTGLEEASGADPGDEGQALFARRDLTDSDLIGIRLGGEFGRLKINYLYRRDNRPRDGTWTLSRSGGGVYYRGFERALFEGVWVSLAGEGEFKLEAEYLEGRSFLLSLERMSAGESESCELEESWETGHRIYLGISKRGERYGVRLSFNRATLDGRRYLREGRPEGSCNVLSGSLSIRLKEHLCNLSARAGSFSAANTGEIFWLQRKNFWLDGDELAFGRLPFLGSRSIYEFRLVFQGDNGEGTRYPYGRELYFSFLHRGDQGDPHRGTAELLFEKWFRISGRLSQMLDIRYVSYRHGEWAGKRNFVDIFTALHGRITDSSWCSVGIGLNPCPFDRWLYRFSDHGREDYLIGKGIYQAMDDSDDAGLMNALKEAETSLSEEWMITFEAGLKF